MAEEKLLTVREVSLLLSISEKEVMDLAESSAIPAYKVGGVFLRFKKEQVIAHLKKSAHAQTVKKAHPEQEYSGEEKIRDFFYFNDFYILAGLLIILLLVIILQG